VIRLAIQDRLLPGASLGERFTAARRFGFDAIELNLPPVLDHAREARAGRVPVSAICGGYRGWLIDPDPEGVRAARTDIKLLLEAGAALGAGCIVVPIWGRTRHLPNIGTGRAREEDESLFLEGMRELATHAERVGGTLLLEPINRYQNDLCVTVADALRLRERIGSPAVRVMVDVFHMNIEEADLGAAIDSARGSLGYVHLADNHRLEPGTGHLDFGLVFEALARISYEGYASLECAGLSGRADAALPTTASFLRERMRAARVA
jgi:sugar phosphate isomerase/epimerase